MIRAAADSLSLDQLMDSFDNFDFYIKTMIGYMSVEAAALGFKSLIF